MDYLTDNDIVWLGLTTQCDFQAWVLDLAYEFQFDYADGPLDAPIN